MKKLLSIILAALMVLSCLVVPAYAEEPMKFDLVITSGTYVNDGTGAEITADVVVSNVYNQGYTGAIINITIPDGLVLINTADPNRSVKWIGEVLEYAEAKTAGMVSGTTNVLSLGFGISSAFIEDGVIATIRFVVADDATLIGNDFGLKLEVPQLVAVEYGEHFSTDPDFAQFVTYPTAPVEAIDKEKATEACKHPETEKVDAKPATCTEPGYSAGEKCKFCGEPIGNTTVESALGHDFQKDHTIEEATCTKTGKDLYKCTRCDETEERETPKKPHVESKDYKSDGTSHWLYCVNCNAVIEDTKEAHKPDTAWHNEDVSVDGHYHICSVCKAAVGVEEHVDKDADGVCDVCEAALHEHQFDTSKWEYDGDVHYHACTVPGCKARDDVAEHELDEEVIKEATCTEKGSVKVSCTICDYEDTIETDMIPHTPDTEWHTEEGSDKHWHNCTVCGNKIEDTAVAHTYGEYKTTEDEHTHTCTVCEATVTEKHKESEDYKSDDKDHWRYCTVCGYEFEKTAHESKEALVSDSTGHWKVCDECGEKFEFDPHTGAVLTPEKAATAKEDGNMAYWYCPGCGKYFYDDNGKIGAGPFDNTDKFITKFDVGCNGNHDLICYPVNNISHMYVCLRNCGFATTTSHIFGANGVCKDCGYTLVTETTGDNVVDVDAPTEAKISVEIVETVR